MTRVAARGDRRMIDFGRAGDARPMSAGRATWLVATVLLVTVLGGCGRPAATIPPGAQQVQVTMSGSEVRLDPAMVRPGDVYVVLDTPGSSVGFAQRMQT